MRSGRLEIMYKKLVIASRNYAIVPQSVQRYYNSLLSFEYAEVVLEFIGERNKVLIIGDAGARDYYYLKAHGKNVIGLDIAKQDIIPDLVIGDAEKLPFKDNCFDAVVAMEIIEHLFGDFIALFEIRRVLSENGIFVLSVPFGNDIPDYHVRVYTPKTIRRLLEFSGFKIEEFIEKGGGFAYLERFRPYVYLKHGLNLISWKIFHKTFYHKLNKVLAKLDKILGEKCSFLHRWSKLYGVFIKCCKSQPKDFKKMNIDTFTNHMV